MFRLCLKIVALSVAVVTASAQQAQRSDERGIRLRDQPANVQYDLELIRGDSRAVVPVNYRFQSGDRFALRVRVAAPYYVYLLNRTFVGAPDEIRSSRQIRLVPSGNGETPGPGQSAAPRSSAYSLVYPTSGDRQLKPGDLNILPDSSMALEMDEHPGVEHMVLVASPTPLKITSMFAANGELLVPGTGAGAQENRSSEIQARLNEELAEMAKNAEVEEVSVPSRSIQFIKIDAGPQQTAEQKPSLLPPTGKNAEVPTVGLKDPTGTENTGPKSGKAGSGSAGKPANTAAKVVDPSSVGVPKRPERPFLVDILLAHYAK